MGAITKASKASYDPVSKKLLVAGARGVAVFDPAKFMPDAQQPAADQTTYTYHRDSGSGILYPVLHPEFFAGAGNKDGNAAVAPTERLFVLHGRNNMQVFKINDGDVTTLERTAIVNWRDGPWAPTASALDWHPERKLFVIWDGTRRTWTFDPVTLKFEYYPNQQSVDAPASGRSRTIYGKGRFVPEHNLFAGMSLDNGGRAEKMWFYRLPSEPGPDALRVALEAKGYTCADTVWAWSCPKLQALVTATVAGGTLTLAKGVYRSCAVIDTPITINGAGSDINGVVCGGKAAFVAKADLTLIDLECQGHGAHADNLSCVRREREAANITFRGVYCHDSSTCLVGRTGAGDVPVGTITILDSTFERLGGDGGRSHALYLRGVDRVEIRGTTFMCMIGQGHHLKTGARTTLVDNVLFDGGGPECNDSRLIDNFGGGTLLITNSQFIESDRDDQRQMVVWVPGTILVGDPPEFNRFIVPPELGERRVLSITGSSFDCGSNGIAARLPGDELSMAWMQETPEDLGGETRFGFVWDANTTTGACTEAPPTWPPVTP